MNESIENLLKEKDYTEEKIEEINKDLKNIETEVDNQQKNIKILFMKISKKCSNKVFTQ